MTSPSPGAETTEPWQGGLTAAGGPPGLPDLSSGGLTVVTQQSATAASGALVCYQAGVFTRQFWSTGPPVPLLIELLPRQQVQQVLDQVLESLRGPGSGLDDIPVRAFAEAARLYLEPGPSDRFTEAVFGSIAQPNPGELTGDVSWPSGTAGTVLGSANRVSAQTHLAPVPAGNPTPLREADLRSLVQALEKAIATAPIDPLWQQMLTFAQDALP
jgi:hypothetical protein